MRTHIEEEHVIVKMLPVGPLQANCYIVGCETTKRGAVIDPGDEAQHILRVVDEMGLKLTYVLLTHAHFDHMAAADEVVKASGAPLAVHPGDLPLLKAGGGAPFFGIPAPPIPQPTIHLEEDQEIAIGQVTLRVLHTPGHSPGHVTFYAAKQGAIFDGDVLFAEGIGRADLPGGSYAVLMHSISEILMKLPDETLVYSGHGPVTSIGRERVSNPWL
jgi:glyoxylase-like metal-dependent hydrolase (beta-lactamase superfamily II)